MAVVGAGGGTIAANGASIQFDPSGAAVVGVGITGDGVGTLRFEVFDGQNWNDANVFTIANAAAAVTVTLVANTPVSRKIDTTGARLVRARATAWTSGTTTLDFVATDGMVSSGGGGGGGGGAVTVADGADVAQGATADAAATGDHAGTVNAHLRGVTKTTGDPTDAAVTGDTAGTVSAHLRGVTKTTGDPTDAAVTGDTAGTVAAHLRGRTKTTGDPTDAAPGTDTATATLNGRLQRVAQRLTSLIALLPGALVGGRLDVNLGAAP